MAEHTLRPGWEMWRFDQIAVNVGDRVEPGEVDVDYYVGLEHLDSDSLKIRRWGDPSDVEATKLLFRKGDIIFGRRRVYQRKLAVAEFDGICSAHAMVLRPRTDVALPEFLPFFMQSDLFMTRALEISVGSLSPTINWRMLAQQEFVLPPLAEQRRYSDLLRQIGRHHETLVSGTHRLQKLKHSLEKNVFASNQSYERISLRELLERGTLSLQTGPFGTVLKASSYTDSGHPVVNPSDMADGRIVLDKCRFIGDADWDRLHRYRLETNDLFIGRKGDMQNIVFVEPEYDGFVLGSDCIRFRVHDTTLMPRYLFYYLRADITRQWLQAQAYGTIMPGINERLLARMVMHYPQQRAQVEAIEQLQAVDQSEHSLKARLEESQKLKLATLAMLESG
jgi:type I restriction enzyme S subunit